MAAGIFGAIIFAVIFGMIGLILLVFGIIGTVLWKKVIFKCLTWNRDFVPDRSYRIWKFDRMVRISKY